jgi:hypothetical protein
VVTGNKSPPYFTIKTLISSLSRLFLLINEEPIYSPIMRMRTSLRKTKSILLTSVNVTNKASNPITKCYEIIENRKSTKEKRSLQRKVILSNES